MRFGYMVHYLNKHFPEYGLFASEEDLREYFKNDENADQYVAVKVPVFDPGQHLTDEQVVENFRTWPRQGQR